MTLTEKLLGESGGEAGAMPAATMSLPRYVWVALHAEGETPSDHKVSIPGVRLYTDYPANTIPPFVQKMDFSAYASKYQKHSIYNPEWDRKNTSDLISLWLREPVLEPGMALKRISGYILYYHPSDKPIIRQTLDRIKLKRKMKHASAVDDYIDIALAQNQPFTMQYLLDTHREKDPTAPYQLTSAMAKGIRQELNNKGFSTTSMPYGQNYWIEIFWKP